MSANSFRRGVVVAVGLSLTEANTFVNAFIAAYPWILLHTGNPGAAGTLAVATNAIRKDAGAVLSAASGGVSTNTGSIEWPDGEVSGSESYSFFSLWSAETAGVFGGSGNLQANDVAAIGDAFSILASGLTVGIAVAS